MAAHILRLYLESLLLERDCSPTHAASLRYRVDKFGDWLGHLATLADLQADIVNGWVLALQQTGKFKPRTVIHFRDAILFVWRAAFERGDVPTPPNRIRQVKVPQQVVTAWTLEELRELVSAVTILRGRVPGHEIRKADWMRGYIYTGYCTGLRRCDLVNCAHWRNVTDDVLTVVQNKTGFVVSRRLTKQSVEALTLIGSNDYVLPWGGRRRSFYESFKRLVASAGIRPGTPKMLRRTAGSMVERFAPGTGGHFLGHRDPSLFDKHYHDRSISSSVPEPPPEI